MARSTKKRKKENTDTANQKPEPGGFVMNTEDITEKKKDREEIKRSRELLKTTIDSSVDMIQVFESVRNEQGEIVDFVWVLNNETAERMYGDVIGKSLLTLNPEVVKEGIFDTFKQVAETGMPDQSERHYVHEQFDGWFYQSTVKLNDGVATTTRDITERKNAEQEILSLKEEIAKKATNKYSSLFNSIDQGFCIIELLYNEAGKAVDYQWLEANPNYEKHSGIKNPVGKKGSEVIPDTEGYWIENFNQVVVTGTPSRFENWHEATGRWYQTHAARLGDESSRQLAIVFDDITERKQREINLAFIAGLVSDFAPLATAKEIMELAGRRLTEHLGLSRYMFVEIHPEEGTCTYLLPSHPEGQREISGSFVLADYHTEEEHRLLSSGHPMIVNDVADGSRTPEQIAAFEAFNIASIVNTPYISNGRWVFDLGVARSKPSVWRNDEIELLRELSGLLWLRIERARAEEALQQSEEKYRTLFESMDEGVVTVELIFDANGTVTDYRYLEHNAAITKQIGLGGELMGKTAREAFAGIEEYWFETMDRIHKTGQPVRQEFYFEAVDGWFDSYMSSVGGKGSNKVICVYQNITERKRREQQQKFLLKLSDTLRTVSDADAIAELAVNMLAAELHLDRCYIVVRRSDGDLWDVGVQFFVPALPPMPPVLDQREFPVSLRIITEGPLVFNNTNELPDLTEMEKKGLQALGFGGLVMGVLRKGGKNPSWSIVAASVEPRQWTSSEVVLIQEVGERVWAAVEKAKAEEAVQRSEEKYRTLFETMDEGYCLIEVILDKNGNPVDEWFLEMNPAYVKHTGLPNDIVGKRTSEIVPNREPEWGKFFGDVALTGKSAYIEYHVNEIGRWFSTHASRVGGEGSLKVAVLFNDITERKKAEEALRESEEKFASLFEASPAPSLILKPDAPRFTITEVNGAYLHATMRSREQLIGQGLFEAFPDNPDDAEGIGVSTLRASLERLLATRNADALLDLKYDIARPDGTFEERWWSPVNSPVLNELGEVKAIIHHVIDVTERHRSEEALRQSEARFRTLADAVPQLIWANDAAGKATYFNKRWYEYSGLNYEASVGLGWEAIVHPDDTPASVEKWHHALSAGEIFDTEYRLKRYDGIYRWFIGRNIPLKNDAGKVTGWFGSATDIEDLKQTSEALSQSEARLKITMESATDYAIITMDTERRIERWSKGAELIFGYTEAEVKGQSADVIFTEEDRKAGIPQKEMETAKDTGRAPDDRWHKRKDGSRFFVNGVMRPIENNHLTGYVKVMRDMTQQQLFTEELHRLVAEQTVELQRSNEDLRQFAHVASHDLKEPIRKIQTFNNRILDEYADALPPRVKTFSEKIGTAADRMIAMIEGVLRYSKLGNIEQARVPVNLNETIRQITIDLEVPIQQKAAEITAAELPTLNANPTLMYQLFYNLILNSLKFAKAGEPPRIRISFETLGHEEKEFAKITVSDNGIGIEPEFSEEIFKTFTRLHPAEDYEGTGLGLALCKKIVERHGGTIAAGGEPGIGATFTIRLPLEKQ
ncbi:MAG: PAS domain S-box protein [Flavisolibacter sp.]